MVQVVSNFKTQISYAFFSNFFTSNIFFEQKIFDGKNYLEKPRVKSSKWFKFCPIFEPNCFIPLSVIFEQLIRIRILRLKIFYLEKIRLSWWRSFIWEVRFVDICWIPLSVILSHLYQNILEGAFLDKKKYPFKFRLR